jgi:glutaredoxin
MIRYLICFLLLITSISLHAQDRVVPVANAAKVIVYGSAGCHFCEQTQAVLQKNNISFVFFDVDTQVEARREMIIKLKKAGIPLSAIQLPVLDWAGKIVMKETDFEQFLKNIEKLPKP